MSRPEDAGVREIAAHWGREGGRGCASHDRPLIAVAADLTLEPSVTVDPRAPGSTYAP
jgi:hypothetical protein